MSVLLIQAPKWRHASRSNGTKQSPEWHLSYIEIFYPQKAQLKASNTIFFG
jgi:hypothetical protein